jgi:hypothetical protein
MRVKFGREEPWIVAERLHSLGNFMSLRCLEVEWSSSLQTTAAVDLYLGMLATAAPRLTSLFIVLSCGITSAGLASLAPLTMLQELRIIVHSKGRPADGALTEGLVGLLPQLTALQHLSCHTADIDADALRTLYAARTLESLQRLDLRDCEEGVDDACLVVIARLASLQQLRVARCVRITDAGLQALAPLGALQELGLNGLPLITDEGLKALAPLTALRYLNVSCCDGITDECHDTIRNERPGLMLKCSCSHRWRPASCIQTYLRHGNMFGMPPVSYAK